MNHDNKPVRFTPLMALIAMLTNELAALQYCMKNRSGWLSIVQSTIRILRTPQTGDPTQDITLGDWFASMGFSKAFVGMYGDAFLHYTQWEALLRRESDGHMTPTTSMGHYHRASIGEVYLTQVLRFLIERQEQINQASEDKS